VPVGELDIEVGEDWVFGVTYKGSKSFREVFMIAQLIEGSGTMFVYYKCHCGWIEVEISCLDGDTRICGCRERGRRDAMSRKVHHVK
jgi:hypothetical protein